MRADRPNETASPPVAAELADPVSLARALHDCAGQLARVELPAGLARDDATMHQLGTLAATNGLVTAQWLAVSASQGELLVVDGRSFGAEMTQALARLRQGELAGEVARLAQPPARPSPLRRLRSSWVAVGRFPRWCRWLRARGVLTDDRLIRVQVARGLDPYQRRPEIRSLAALVRAKGVGSVLEIGTANAGTFAFLANVTPAGSRLVTLDLARPAAVDLAVAMAPAASELVVETGDSHDPAVVRSVHERWPDGFDLVFIDGDHSYEGVKADTVAFADLVAPGGLLVFHDIVPSVHDRFGVRTLAEVGGVPRWWREFTAELPEGAVAHELIADPTQDGMGIGVIELPAALDGAALLAGRGSCDG